MKAASSSNDVIGMNLISFFVDEANFFKGDGVTNKGNSMNDVQSKARELYNSVRTRGKSRFVVNNEDFTFNILVSSSMYDSSFTAERINESVGDSHVKVFEPKKLKYYASKNYFSRIISQHYNIFENFLLVVF